MKAERAAAGGRRRFGWAALACGLSPLAGCRAKASMKQRPIDPTEVSYAQALEVSGFSRLLFVSGQVPEGPGGEVPEDFRSQCRLAWANVEARLGAAGMTLDNVVKVTIFLSDRRYRRENAEVRAEVLGKRTPALTVIITGIYDEAWLLEIEAVAAALPRPGRGDRAAPRVPQGGKRALRAGGAGGRTFL
jgi:2-iminobutanoate/2-iminopropanoate deaminase